MKILVNIDQKRALLEGIDAPASTTHIDVDPQQLTEEERALLSGILKRGHDATGSIFRQLRGRGGSTSSVKASLFLVHPTVEGLKLAIAEATNRLDQREKEAVDSADVQSAKNAERVAEEVSEWDARIEKYLAEPEAGVTVFVGIIDGEVELVGKGQGSTPLVSITIPTHALFVPHSINVNPVLRERLDARRSERERIIQEARPALEDKAAAVAAEEEATKADYDALYARLPEGLRTRDREGYAGENEVVDAIYLLARADAGYTSPLLRFSDYIAADGLTDGQYRAFLDAKKAAPSGAKVEAVTFWNQTYRDATDDDNCEDINSDGKVTRRKDECTLAMVSWKTAGLAISVGVPLS